MLVQTLTPFLLLALTKCSSAIPASTQKGLLNSDALTNPISHLAAKDPNNHNNDNTCGIFSGLKCDPLKPGSGWCCSSYGFCGNSKIYCGPGCQQKYGRCNASKPGKRPPKVKHCGPKHKNKKCQKGYCCSSNGLCGDTPSFCGKHCQAKYGHCDASKDKPEPSPKPTPLPPPKQEERCGPQHNNHKCSQNQCCSHAGYCGVGPQFCAVPQNCQRQFGWCDSNATPSGISTEKDSRPLVGEISYDVPIKQCRKPRTIAMTFDDGPSNNTQKLLDILAKSNAKATFFIGANNNGKGEIDKTDIWVAAIKRMNAEGHQIASHLWSHPHLNSLSSAERKSEVFKTERALANILGKYPSYMRAPYIECSRKSGCMADMKSLGYHVVSWGIDSTDWKHENDLPAMKAAIDAGFNSAPDDGNMLLIQHDTIPKSSLELTEYVLQKVREKGWKTVPLHECLEEPAKFAYRYPSRTAARSMVQNACFVSDNQACAQLRPFESKEQCRDSNKKCFKQSYKHYSGKEHTVSFLRMHNICSQQFFFCEKCGKKSQPDCKLSKFEFNGMKEK